MQDGQKALGPGRIQWVICECAVVIHPRLQRPDGSIQEAVEGQPGRLQGRQQL